MNLNKEEAVIMVLALVGHHKGNNARCVRSPVVDEERWSPGHWLGSVLCVSFCVLIPLVGREETTSTP